ncbi:hypothetical protein DICA4_B02718 [Diutina catenulata]
MKLAIPLLLAVATALPIAATPSQFKMLEDARKEFAAKWGLDYNEAYADAPSADAEPKENVKPVSVPEISEEQGEAMYDEFIQPFKELKAAQEKAQE